MRQSTRYMINVVSNWTRLVALTAVGLFIVPYALHGLGDIKFGIYGIAGSVIRLLVLLDAGLQAAVVRYASRDQAAGDHRRLLETTSTGLAVMAAVGLVAAAVGIGAIPVVRQFFRVPTEFSSELASLMIFMALSVAFQLLTLTPAAVLVGAQRYELRNGIDIITGLSRCGLLVAFFELSGPSLFVFGLSQLMAQVFRFTAMYSLARWHLLRHALFVISSVTKASFLRLANFGVLNTINVLGALLITQGQNLIVGRLLGLEHVAILVPAMMVATQLMAVVVGLASPVLPIASRYAVKDEGTRLGRLSIRISRLSFLMSLAFVMPLVIFAEPVIRVWLGDEYAWTRVIFSVCVLTALLRTVQGGNYYMVVGGGKIVAWGISQVLAGVVGLGAAVAGNLLFGWGVLGIVLCVSAAVVVRAVVVLPIISCRQFGVFLPTYYWQTYARPILAAALPAGVSLAGYFFFYPDTFWLLVAQVLLNVILFAVSAWVLAMGAEDKALLREASRGLLRRAGRGGEPQMVDVSLSPSDPLGTGGGEPRPDPGTLTRDPQDDGAP